MTCPAPPTRSSVGLRRTVVDTWPERPELSVVDVYLAEVARRDGSVPLLTFDRKLANELDVAESF